MADCLPFNSIKVDGKYDRAYKAEDWMWYFATFLSTGVFPKPSDGLQVIAYEGMEVKVNFGYAFINGCGFRNPTSKSITLDMAEGALNRIDRVVVRWDLVQRDTYIDVLKGVPSAKPVAATLTRNTEVWELALADIYIGRGVTRILTQNITDQRFNSAVCGIVTGTIKEIDASTITKQFDDFVKNYTQEKTAEYEKWVESAKDALEKVENGKLLLEINNMLVDMYRMATDDDIDKIINETYKDEDDEGSILETGSNQDIDDILNGTYTDIDDDSGGNEEKDTLQDITNIVNNAFKEG